MLNLQVYTIWCTGLKMLSNYRLEALVSITEIK